MNKNDGSAASKAGTPPKNGKIPSGLSGTDSEKLDQISTSLKKVYQSAVDERVPDEMMELLKKLG